MAIILIVEHIPGIIQQVHTQLQHRYNLTGIEISTRFIRDLPRDESGYSTYHLKDMCITDYYPLKDSCMYVDDISNASVIADVIASQHIKPVITWTDDISVAAEWLTGIEQTYDTIAVDFEARDLTLPQFNHLTMVTIGWNLTKSVVIVFKDDIIRDFVLNWLVTTQCRQVYHNALFDTRFVHYHTGKLPHNIEDSQLLAAVYHNHVNPDKRKTGLKQLAKYPYLDWATDKSSFDLYVDSSDYVNPNLHYVGSNPTPYMYNLPLIYYCGIDACATHLVWSKYDFELAHPTEWIPQTSEPRYNIEQFNQRYYYDFILKPAIPVIVEMLNTGQAIDLDKVTKLLGEVEAFNKLTLESINSYKLVQDFQSVIDQERIDKFLAPIHKVWAHPKYIGYQSNPAMRAFVVNHLTGSTYTTLSDKELKAIADPLVQPLINKQYDHPDIVAACNLFTEQKAHQQNLDNNRIDKVANPQNYLTLGFNPWNYSQLTKMWMDFGLESDEISKDTGQPSFSGKVLERLQHTTTGDVQQIIKHYLEIAQSKNMITQYIPKYFGSTVDGRLHYALKLFGTFTGRLSGKAGGDKLDESVKHQLGANGVTQPVGHRVYGKTVKSMFIAPPGRILAAVDYNGLENHINACLTKDPTTIKLLSPDPETGLMWDMHTLHSSIFYKEQWEELTQQPFVNNIQYNQLCYDLTESNKLAKQLRTDSKPVTFKCAYGGFPDAHKGGAITQEIFDRYHGELYPGVAQFRDEYVVPTSRKQKYLHLNWGLRVYSDDPKRDLLALNNANFQGYSDLTLIAAINFRNAYLANVNPNNIQGLNIIHDALYYELDDTPEAIKWLNDHLIPIMVQDFLHDQTVHLRAECDFGYDQAHMVTLSNNADLATIEAKLATLAE